MAKHVQNEVITSFDYQRLVRLILSVRRRVFYCTPGIHEEIASALEEAARKGLDVKIILDPSEDNFRNGFGEIKSIFLLRDAGISIFEHSNNMVSFLICDQTGYFIFPQSRIFAEEGTGPNAIRMEPLTLSRIISHYFPPQSELAKKEFQDELIDAYAETKTAFKKTASESQSLEKKIVLQPLDSVKLAKVDRNLELTPPVHPDLKRQINTYTAKLQFLELKFEGSNFHVAKVRLPENVLPFKDPELKKMIDTRLKLFENLDNDPALEKLLGLKSNVEAFRKKYLTHVPSRGKSVFRIEHKQEILTHLKRFEEQRQESTENLNEALERQILDTKEKLKMELVEFYNNNPPQSLSNYSEGMKQRKIDDLAQKNVSEVKFPEVSGMIERIRLTYNFYDITFEDFKEAKFLEELADREIIKKNEMADIVTIKNAFEAKI